MEAARDGFAIAFASAAALAATLPVARRALPAGVRAALALSIAPLAVAGAAAGNPSGDLALRAIVAAAAGASVGLTASIVAGGMEAAAALVDSVISPSGFNSDPGGEHGGPFGGLVSLLFAYVFCATGALSWLLANFAASSHALVLHVTAAAAPQLARAGFDAAVTLALPPLCAHGLATLVAGITARLAPRVSGLLLAPALSAPLVLLIVLVGVPATFAAAARISHLCAWAALHP